MRNLFDMALVLIVIVNLLKLVFLIVREELCSVWEIPGCTPSL